MRKLYFLLLALVFVPNLFAQKNFWDNILVELSASPFTISTDDSKMDAPFFSGIVGYRITPRLSVQIGGDYQFFYRSGKSAADVVYPVHLGVGYVVYNPDNDWKIELALRGGATTEDEKYDYSFYDISGKLMYKMGFLQAGIRHAFREHEKNALIFYLGYGVRF